MKRVILYNSLAGNGAGKERAEALLSRWEGEEPDFLDIAKIDSYLSLFQSLAPEDELILTGGDGTLNRFVNDTEGLALPEKIYYYPTGSGNDFWHDLELPADAGPQEIGRYLRDLPAVTCKEKTRRVLNGVGYGIDGYCCEVGDKLRETSDKPVNYASIAIKGLLFHFKPVTATVTVDGKEYVFEKTWIAPTMNGRFYGGGMMPTPDQKRLADDPKVSLMLMHGSGKLKTLMIFPSLFKGEHVKHTKYVTVLEGKEIRVAFDRPCALQIDGETVLNVGEYSVKTAK
ncbi:MAG: diacylglycerol kinase family protein [Clostridia bacterium]|nr:diacylglycerol kinase family protein [Clostridia bacterium]